jgi:hypothetical protein
MKLIISTVDLYKNTGVIFIKHQETEDVYRYNTRYRGLISITFCSFITMVQISVNRIKKILKVC